MVQCRSLLIGTLDKKLEAQIAPEPEAEDEANAKDVHPNCILAAPDADRALKEMYLPQILFLSMAWNALTALFGMDWSCLCTAAMIESSCSS